MRPRKIFHDLFVLAVLGDDFLEFRMLLGDFLETRGIAHDLRRRKLLRHLLVARVELVQFFSQGKNGHGKSTLIGRIFYDTHSLPDGKVEQIQAACKEEGMEFEYAFLLDALLEEQEQNITIDTTQIQFRTAKRSYTIIDAPGHEEFIKNMITGAAGADAAVIVIAADEGSREQSRRHGQWRLNRVNKEALTLRWPSP